MAEQETETAEQQAEQDKTASEQPAQEQPAQEPKSEPSFEHAYKRAKAESDALKQQLKEAQDKLADAKTLDDIEKAKLALKEDFDARILESNIDLALIKAGCIDTKAARVHLDTSKLMLSDGKVEGLDVEALAKEYAYLFQKTPKTSTGAPPKGAPDKETERIAALRKASGLADKTD